MRKEGRKKNKQTKKTATKHCCEGKKKKKLNFAVRKEGRKEKEKEKEKKKEQHQTVKQYGKTVI